MSVRGIRRFYLPFLIVAVLAVYSVTLKHGFVWDDTIYTVGNPVYREFDVSKIFFSLANGVEYLPLRDVVNAVDYQIWGERPFGFHLTNLLLFLLDIVLIYFFTAELPLTGDDIELRRLAAFLTALLFAVHPLNSEAVNLITFRNVLLSAAAFFLAAVIFIRDLKSTAPFTWRTALWLSLCFLAALLSKATSIILPLVLLLLAVYVPSRRSVRQKALTLAPLGAMALLFFALFRSVATASRIIISRADVPVLEKAAIALQIPFFYLQKFFIPLGYSAEYANDKFSQVLFSSGPLLSFIGLAVLVTAAVRLRYRLPLAGFALIWYGITLLPVLNLFATNPIVADRYAFLPVYALAVLAAFLLAGLVQRRPRIASMAVLASLLSLAGITYARNLDWRTDTSLWQANIRTEPANAKGYLNLGAEAIIAGDYPAARRILAEGRAKAPSPVYDYLEGKIYYLNHDLGRALEAFKTAVRNDRNNIRSLLNIGMIYQEMGDYPMAAEYYRKTLEANAADGWGCRDQARERLRLFGTFGGK